MKREALLNRVKELAERSADAEAVELIDVSVARGKKRSVIRVVIDQPEGISHEECIAVSRKLSVLLDVADLFEERYVLEVSSPGLDRELKNASDFRRAVGKLVKLTLLEEISKQRRMIGRLLNFDEKCVKVELHDSETITVPLERIKKIQLEPEVTL
jgi:ribosome maturation factor RimP